MTFFVFSQSSISNIESRFHKAERQTIYRKDAKRAKEIMNHEFTS
jgi:hypothetical protein